MAAGSLHACLGREPGQHQLLDAVLLQLVLEVGAEE